MELAQEKMAQTPENSKDLLEVAKYIVGQLDQLIRDVERMLAVQTAKVEGGGPDIFADEKAIRSIATGQTILKEVLVPARNHIQDLTDQYSLSLTSSVQPMAVTASA